MVEAGRRPPKWRLLGIGREQLVESSSVAGGSNFAAQRRDLRLQQGDALAQAVILLAMSLHADLLLMDDRKGVRMARGKGFRVTGTLGILEIAARREMLDLADAFARLRCTTFHCSEAVMAELLAREKKRGQP